MNNNGLLIIYTGGTIGMSKIDNEQEFLINKDEVLNSIIDSLNLKKTDKVVLTKKIIDSSQLDYEMVNDIIGILKTEYLGYKGFIIISGTDTMAYLQSLLKWQIRGLEKPIILTGAIKSYDEDKNEGKNNIKFAIDQIDKNLNKGIIGIAMNNQILINPTSKFDSVSPSPYRETNNSYLEKYRLELFERENKLNFNYLKDIKVEIIYLNPFIFIEKTSLLADGLLILAYGQGTFKEDLSFKKRVELYSQYKKPIVVISQCINNDLNVEQYSSGIYLAEFNVKYCGGSCIEEGLAYLHYLINNNILLC